MTSRSDPVASVLLTTSYPPDPGGIATLLGNVSSHLARPPAVLVPDGERAASAPGLGHRVAYHVLWRLHPSLYYLWRLWRPTLRTAEASRVEVVQVGHVYVGLAALLLRRSRGLPYVVYAHAQEVRPDRWSGLPGLDRALRGLVLRGASAVLVLSGYTRDLVLSWGVGPERVVRLPGGGFAGPLEAADAAVERHGPTLLTVARLVPRKGIDTVLAALLRVRATFPDVRYLVVGSGPDESRLRGLVRRYGLAACVRFLGAVSQAQLARYYAACDLLVMPAREAPDGEVEGFGLVFLEAASFGKPSVAGRSGGQADAVLDGVTGVVVDPVDVGAVGEVLARLLGDRALLERMGRAARQRVERECTWQRTGQLVDAVLAQVARGASLGRASGGTPGPGGEAATGGNSPAGERRRDG